MCTPSCSMRWGLQGSRPLIGTFELPDAPRWLWGLRDGDSLETVAALEVRHHFRRRAQFSGQPRGAKPPGVPMPLLRCL